MYNVGFLPVRRNRSGLVKKFSLVCRAWRKESNDICRLQHKTALGFVSDGVSPGESPEDRREMCIIPPTMCNALLSYIRRLGTQTWNMWVRRTTQVKNMLIEAWNGSIYRWHGVSLWWKCLSTPFIYTLFYIIYIIYTFGYFTHTVYTHSLPCVFIHYMCFVCILRLHPCAKRYVLFRAISSSIHY